MTKSATLAPKLDKVRLHDLTVGDVDRLEPHESYEGQRYESVDVSASDLTGVSFAECEFLSLTINEVNFRSASFVESCFDRLNAPIFSASRSRWRDVTIESSRLGSAEFYEASWQSVHLINCKLGFVNLRGASLQDVLFTNCTIAELDLGGAKANRVAFADTEVGTLDLTRSTLKNVDLRGLDMRQVSGLDGLRGATMNSFQITQMAPLFAAQFGIRIDD